MFNVWIFEIDADIAVIPLVGVEASNFWVNESSVLLDVGGGEDVDEVQVAVCGAGCG